MENLAIWNKYKAVPENALKDFDNGRFKGTDINTMWRLKSLTEEFGMCGVGWYYDIVKIWNETFVEEQITMTFAEIKLYIKVDGEWSKGISGVGGNKMVSLTKDGRVKDNDEAVKMAVTDAIGVACRNLGFGADVYWANDKTKYTDDQNGSEDTGKGQNKTASNSVKTASSAPTLNQLASLKKIKRTTADVAKFFGIEEKAVTAKHVTDYIAKAIEYLQKKKAEAEAQKEAEAEAEAQEIFPDTDTVDFNDPSGH